MGAITVYSVMVLSMSRDNIGSKSLRLFQAPYRYGIKKRIFIIRTIGAYTVQKDNNFAKGYHTSSRPLALSPFHLFD